MYRTSLEPVEHEAATPAEVPGSIRVLRLLWARRDFIFKMTLYGLVFGVLLSFLIPKRFESTTRIMPPDNQGNPLSMLANLANNSTVAQMAGDAMPVKSTGSLFLGVLRSRTLQDRLVNRFSLRERYGLSLAVDARDRLQSNTVVEEDRRAGIISVTVSDRDPNQAAALSRAYVEELDRLMAQLNTSAARREREFIEQRLQVVKKDLDQAAEALGKFSSKNATLDLKDQAKAMVEGAAILQGQLIAAESELQGMRQIYTDNNVRVRSLAARVNELRQQLRKIGGTEGASDADTELGYPSLRKLPLLAVSYAELYRTAKVQEAVFETLTKQYEMSKVQEAKEIPSVRVLDPAEVPERKAYPKRAVVTLVSGFFAFFLACSFVWIAQAWQSVDERDPVKAFLTEVYGTVAPDEARSAAWRKRIDGLSWRRLFRRKAPSDPGTPG